VREIQAPVNGPPEPEAAITAFLSAGFRADQALEVLAVSAASTITNYTLGIAEPPLEAMFQAHAWRP
jgi:hypothetical protein